MKLITLITLLSLVSCGTITKGKTNKLPSKLTTQVRDRN